MLVGLAAKCMDLCLTTWVQTLNRPLLSCQSVGKSHNLFMSQQNEDNTLWVVLRL